MRVKWKDLDPGVKLEILHNVECTATNVDKTIATLKLNPSEKQNAMELLYQYYDFHRKAKSAHTSFSQRYMKYEEEFERNLTRGEVQDLMQQTILAVDGKDEFDKPVKERDICLGRRYLRERGQDPNIITLRPDLSPQERSARAQGFDANLSPHLQLAYQYGRMAFPSLPLDATEEQIRNAPRRKLGSSDTAPEFSTLAEMERGKEDRLSLREQPAAQRSFFEALRDSQDRPPPSQNFKLPRGRCSTDVAEARRGRSEQPLQSLGAN